MVANVMGLANPLHVFFVIGFIGILLLGFFMLMSRPIDRPPKLDLSVYTKCPDCAEAILREAKVCKHCGRRLDDDKIVPARR
jgi:hypothetical protein